MVKRYQVKKMDHLLYQLEEMGHLVLNQLNHSMDSLLQHQQEAAQSVIRKDQKVNELKESIEWGTLQLIMVQQPTEHELHRLVKILRAVRELERIGDLSCNIAELTLYMKEEHFHIHMKDSLGTMKEAVYQMVSLAVEAFCKQDIDLQKQVIEMDDTIDQQFHTNFDLYVEGMSQNHYPIYDTSQLLLVLRYLERMGDHSVNIARLAEASRENQSEDRLWNM